MAFTLNPVTGELDFFNTNRSKLAAGTAGAVLFNSSTGRVSEDAADLFWDSTNNRLTVGSNNSTFAFDGVNNFSKFSVVSDGSSTLTEVLNVSSSTQRVNLIMARSRGTPASKTIVSNGDFLGAITGYGFNGTDYSAAGGVYIQVSGTPGASAMPGKIVFAVTPASSVIQATALTIQSDKTLTAAAYGTGIAHFDSSGNVTSSAIALGSADISGTLGVTHGGTGTATQFTAGSVVFANGSGVYSQDNSNFFWDATNFRLGIGTASPTSTLQVINPAAATVGAIFKAAASQSADLMEWQSSSGTTETKINSDNTLSVKSANYTWPSGAVSQPIIIHNPTVTQNTETVWVPTQLTIAPTFNYGVGQALSQILGISLAPAAISANSLASGSDTMTIIGIQSLPAFNGSVGPRTLTGLISADLRVAVNGTAGTVTTASTVQITPATNASGTSITTRNGLLVVAATANATVTTAHQILLQSQSASNITNNYGLRQQGTGVTNVLNAKTKLGADSVPNVDCDVNGWINYAGETRTTSQFDKTNATLANITGLSVTLVAGRTYRFRADLYDTFAVTSGGQFAVAGTATATYVIYQVTTTRNSNSSLSITGQATALGTAVGGVGTGVGKTSIEGLITVNAGGTLTIQFAQNTAAGGTSSIFQGSTFTVWDVI